jgi:glutamine synthetase
MHDTTYSRELLVSNRANGYRDVLAKIDLGSYRRLPWENNAPFFLVSFYDPETTEPICADPRGTLKTAMDRAKEHGWEAIAGVEYEVDSRWHFSSFANSTSHSTSISKARSKKGNASLG